MGHKRVDRRNEKSQEQIGKQNPKPADPGTDLDSEQCAADQRDPGQNGVSREHGKQQDGEEKEQGNRRMGFRES